MHFLPVIFSRSHLPLSYVIRILDKGAFICPYSHVGIISECENFVYEAKGGAGVIKTPLSKFKSRATKWERGYFPSVNRLAAYQRAESLLGADYDLMGAVAIAIPFISRNWARSDKWFCSEFLAHCSGMFDPEHMSNIGVNFTYALTRKQNLEQSHV